MGLNLEQTLAWTASVAASTLSADALPWHSKAHLMAKRGIPFGTRTDNPNDGKTLSEPIDFSGFVTMKGGEYFFAPSLSYLRSLA